jgi:hypothetical protein
MVLYKLWSCSSKGSYTPVNAVDLVSQGSLSLGTGAPSIATSSSVQELAAAKGMMYLTLND